MLDLPFNHRREMGEGAWRLQTHGSGLLEQVLEYQFLADLTSELLRRGMRFEVLRGDFDLNGHDVVIETSGIMRHIQLKSTVAGGKTRRVPINTGLQAKPSGCVVWMTYDPDSLAITGLRWFGGAPGERLPDLGDRVARHTRANREGQKGERPHIRVLPSSRFIDVPDAAAMADLLFEAPEHAILRKHLAQCAEPASGWLRAVQAGNFAAIPAGLRWAGSVEFAHLVHGYDLAEELELGNPFEYAERQLAAANEAGEWAGSATELWITLFLEHRRWRFSSPYGPDTETVGLLDTLVRQLRDALVGGLCR